MRKCGTSTAARGRKKGSFADSHDELLPLFFNPDGRGERRWREVFGLEPGKIEEKPRPFNVLEVRRSSSGSK